MSPEPLPAVNAQTYGDVATDDATVSRMYGELAIKFNTLREWAKAVEADYAKQVKP